MLEAASMSQTASLKPDDLQLTMKKFFETIRSSRNVGGLSCFLPENSCFSASWKGLSSTVH